MSSANTEQAEQEAAFASLCASCGVTSASLVELFEANYPVPLGWFRPEPGLAWIRALVANPFCGEYIDYDEIEPVFRITSPTHPLAGQARPIVLAVALLCRSVSPIAFPDIRPSLLNVVRQLLICKDDGVLTSVLRWLLPTPGSRFLYDTADGPFLRAVFAPFCTPTRESTEAYLAAVARDTPIDHYSYDVPHSELVEQLRLLYEKRWQVIPHL